MRLFHFCFIACLLISIHSCSKSSKGGSRPLQEYSNEFFTLRYYKDWTYDDSQWNTRKDTQSEVVFFPIQKPGQKDAVCWVSCIEEFVRMRLNSSKEAAILYTMLHPLNKDSTYIKTAYEEDSVVIDNKITYLLVHLRKIANDTVIQKQYIMLNEASGRIYYFNNFYLKGCENVYCCSGDTIIYSIRFKF